MQRTKREIYDLYQELIESVEERRVIVICSWGVKNKCGKQEIATSVSQAVDKLCREHFELKEEMMANIKF